MIISSHGNRNSHHFSSNYTAMKLFLFLLISSSTILISLPYVTTHGYSLPSTRIRRSDAAASMKNLSSLTQTSNDLSKAKPRKGEPSHWLVSNEEELMVDREYAKLSKHSERLSYLLKVVGLYMRIHKYADIDWRQWSFTYWEGYLCCMNRRY